MTSENLKFKLKQNKKASLFCALDSNDAGTVVHLADTLANSVDGLKLGLEFFCANGPQGLLKLTNRDLPIFLDLKLHDIPNTVAKAVRSIAPLKPKYLTIHASGGEAMLKAAVMAAEEEAESLKLPKIRLLAVTILTSLDQKDLQSIGLDVSTTHSVARLASLAAQTGVDGVVCSPKEIETVRCEIGAEKEIFVPGIRPNGSEKGDQKRSATPIEAVNSGATALVVGRPITKSENPYKAALAIKAEMLN